MKGITAAILFLSLAHIIAWTKEKPDEWPSWMPLYLLVALAACAFCFCYAFVSLFR